MTGYKANRPLLEGMKPLPQFPLFGVLNVTPDSFSDGGLFSNSAAAINHAQALLQAGADVIDIGADSTRPGSLCVGAEEEWRRLNDVIPAVCEFGTVSVDTHNPSVARMAIAAGAAIINDISGGRDEEMWDLLVEFPVHLVAMFSRCPEPHDFSQEIRPPIMDAIKNFIDKTLAKAVRRGIATSRIIIDPGMGGFLGSNPETSWQVLRRLPELFAYNQPLLLGISRKRFIDPIIYAPGLEERDLASALISLAILGSPPSCPDDAPFTLGFRVHNPQVHKIARAVWDKLRE